MLLGLAVAPLLHESHDLWNAWDDMITIKNVFLTPEKGGFSRFYVRSET